MSGSSAVSARVVSPSRGPLRGRVRVPGDKSIGHRAVLLNGAARGTARVRNLPDGADVGSSVAVMRALGCRIEAESDGMRIEGRALRFDAPVGVLDCGNSGTTARLVAGLLAGANVAAALDGDASLRRRPMERVARPLRALGADLETTDGCVPLRIRPAKLTGAAVRLEVASAQLKSAVLLAGLSARGRTEVSEPSLSRDHTERMLESMDVRVERRGTTVAVVGPVVPRAVDVSVCGDPSSAAFFAVAAAVVPGSDVVVENVCLNPTRTGFVSVLRRMGADVEVRATGEAAGEPIGEVRVRGSRLRGVAIGTEDVPAAIDELPVLAVAAAFAEGPTTITGAGELRVKESDRIATVSAMLRALGSRVRETDDGMVIDGSGPGLLRGGACVATAHDHRLVMSAAVAALACGEPVEIDDPAAAAVSFPGFFAALESLLP